MEELSPSTAEAETDGMCGLALTWLVSANGASLRMVAFVSTVSSRLVPVDATTVLVAPVLLIFNSFVGWLIAYQLTMPAGTVVNN